MGRRLPEERVDVLEQVLAADSARRAPRRRRGARSRRRPSQCRRRGSASHDSATRPLSSVPSVASTVTRRTSVRRARDEPPEPPGVRPPRRPATRRRRPRRRSTARGPPLRGREPAEAIEIEMRDLDGPPIAVADRERRAHDAARDPSARQAPRTNVVFPAPSSPDTVTGSPGTTAAPGAPRGPPSRERRPSRRRATAQVRRGRAAPAAGSRSNERPSGRPMPTGTPSSR